MLALSNRENFLFKSTYEKSNLRKKWNLVVVYGAAQEENKLAFLSELSHFCSLNYEPLIIGGDFNIIRYSKERNKNNDVQKYTGMKNILIYFH